MQNSIKNDILLNRFYALILNICNNYIHNVTHFHIKIKLSSY